jgi:osmotically-inducible protein OsmY
VLRGEVANEREKALAEAIVRLSPGVREVRNELQPRTTSTPAP